MLPRLSALRSQGVTSPHSDHSNLLAPLFPAEAHASIVRLQAYLLEGECRSNGSPRSFALKHEAKSPMLFRLTMRAVLLRLALVLKPRTFLRRTCAPAAWPLQTFHRAAPTARPPRTPQLARSL